MDDKPTAKSLLHRATHEVLPAAITYGIGYGIAKTLLEQLGPSSTDALRNVRRALPAVVGGVAAYAASQSTGAVRDRVTGGGKR